MVAIRHVLAGLVLFVLGSSGTAAEVALNLAPGKTHFQLLQFASPEKTRIDVIADGEVDLSVIDELGKTVARTFGKKPKLEFPARDGDAQWLVKVVNLSPTKLAGKMTHNLKAPASTPPASLEIPAGKKSGFYRRTEPGKVTVLDATAGGKAPFEMAVYNTDGIKIASDPKGKQVAYEGQENQIIRVSITALEKQGVACKFQWSSLDVKRTALPAFDLEHGAKKTFDLAFPAGKLACLWVTSEKDTDVDLMVYDEKGKEAISDISIGKNCFLAWTPAATANYRVVVVNHGAGANRCVLSHHGAK